MKHLLPFIPALLLGSAVFAQTGNLPGVPATEQVTVTPVEENTGVTVRKVSFLRSNNYAGESGGTPHYSEAPYERVEDIRYAIDYLVTLPFIDDHRIGALGICAGGYVIATAPTDRCIRAVAGVSAADIGAANRESWLRGRTVEEQAARPIPTGRPNASTTPCPALTRRCSLSRNLLILNSMTMRSMSIEP